MSHIGRHSTHSKYSDINKNHHFSKDIFFTLNEKLLFQFRIKF